MLNLELRYRDAQDMCFQINPGQIKKFKEIDPGSMLELNQNAERSSDSRI